LDRALYRSLRAWLRVVVLAMAATAASAVVAEIGVFSDRILALERT
jgi:hypothetical protein